MVGVRLSSREAFDPALILANPCEQGEGARRFLPFLLRFLLPFSHFLPFLLPFLLSLDPCKPVRARGGTGVFFKINLFSNFTNFLHSYSLLNTLLHIIPDAFAYLVYIYNQPESTRFTSFF